MRYWAYPDSNHHNRLPNTYRISYCFGGEHQTDNTNSDGLAIPRPVPPNPHPRRHTISLSSLKIWHPVTFVRV